MKGLKPCETWKRQVKALAARGYFKENGRVKRDYAQLGLGALAKSVQSPRQAKRYMNMLRDCIDALVKERRRFLFLAFLTASLTSVTLFELCRWAETAIVSPYEEAAGARLWRGQRRSR
jgi:hypothetical protein